MFINFILCANYIKVTKACGPINKFYFAGRAEAFFTRYIFFTKSSSQIDFNLSVSNRTLSYNWKFFVFANIIYYMPIKVKLLLKEVFLEEY